MPRQAGLHLQHISIAFPTETTGTYGDIADIPANVHAMVLEFPIAQRHALAHEQTTLDNVLQVDRIQLVCLGRYGDTEPLESTNETVDVQAVRVQQAWLPALRLQERQFGIAGTLPETPGSALAQHKRVLQYLSAKTVGIVFEVLETIGVASSCGHDMVLSPVDGVTGMTCGLHYVRRPELPWWHCVRRGWADRRQHTVSLREEGRQVAAAVRKAIASKRHPPEWSKAARKGHGRNPAK
jgi:hypothetical protein